MSARDYQRFNQDTTPANKSVWFRKGWFKDLLDALKKNAPVTCDTATTSEIAVKVKDSISPDKGCEMYVDPVEVRTKLGLTTLDLDVIINGVEGITRVYAPPAE